MSDSWVLIERKKTETGMQENMQHDLQQDMQHDLQENAPLQQNREQQINQNTVDQRPVLELPANEIHGNVQVYVDEVKIPMEEEKPKFIGFNKCYIDGQNKDNEKMKELRRVLKVYFDDKETFEDIIRTQSMEEPDPMEYQAYYERILSTLEVIRDLCEQYKHTSVPLLKGRGEAKKRKEEVAKLSKRIESEIENNYQVYSAIMENEFASRAKHDPNLKKRVSKTQSKLLSSGKTIAAGQGGKLNLDRWNRNLGFAEYEHLSVKNYLQRRSAFEVRKKAGKKDYYNSKEKALLNTINEYAQIQSIGRFVASKSNGITEKQKYIALQQKEYKLYKKISGELDALLKNKNVSNDKKSAFLSLRDLIFRETKGTLDYGDADVTDCTQMNKFKITDLQSGGEKKINTVDRSGDPLFAHVPCVSDIAQTRLGNCFLMSSIAEIVADDPALITDMFKEEGDNVVVRLYHRDMQETPANSGNYTTKEIKPVYIRINKKVEEKLNQGALWVSLLCKAYSVYVQKYDMKSEKNTVVNETNKKLKDSLGNQIDSIIDYGFVNNGGKPEDVFPILLGKKKGKEISISGNVFKAQTLIGVINEDNNPNYGRVTIDQNLTHVQDIGAGNEETVIFDYNNIKYVYRKEIEEDLLKDYGGIFPWKDMAQRLQYLTNFSVGSELLLLNSQKRKDGTYMMFHEVLRDPATVEEYIKKADRAPINGYINACFEELKKAGAGITQTKEDDFKNHIFEMMKKDAIKTLKEGCDSAKRMTKAKESQAKFFTGDYTDEALDVFRQIEEMSSKGIKMAASSRPNLSNEKSESGKETVGDGVTDSHGYSVLGTEKLIYNGKPILMVRVRNPWGSYTASYRENKKANKVEAFTEKRADSGEFLMELTHFVQTFFGLSTYED